MDRANFKVDSLTGWITANVVFDRETRDSYQTTVIAMDQGKPRQSSSVLVNVTILDVNDHVPTLVPNEGELRFFNRGPLPTGRIGQQNTFAVAENSPRGTFLGTLVALDGDLGRNADLVFELINDSVSQYHKRFQLSEKGLLYTTVSLDREEKDHYRLSVRVSDRALVNPLTSTGTIDVLVQDVNDNSPNLVSPAGMLPLDQITPDSKPEPTVQLSVNEQPGFVVTKIRAEDPDAGSNGRVMYYLEELNGPHPISAQSQKPLLQIDPQEGDIVLQRFMSSSDLGMRYFHVRAVDGGQSDARTDSKILVLSIVDLPMGELYSKNLHASNYYPSNGTSYAFRLWSFGGPRNTVMISLLASISGLLAAILIIAIACVLKSKNRRRRRRSHGLLCCRRGRRRRTAYNGTGGSVVGPPEIVPPENRNGTNGSYMHHHQHHNPHDLSHMIQPNGTHYTGPPAGLNLSMLLEDWQPGRNGTDAAGGGLPHIYQHPHHPYDGSGVHDVSLFCSNEPNLTSSFPQYAITNSWRQTVNRSTESGLEEQPTSDSGRGGSEEDDQPNSGRKAQIVRPTMLLTNTDAFTNTDMHQTLPWQTDQNGIGCIKSDHFGSTVVDHLSPFSVNKVPLVKSNLVQEQQQQQQQQQQQLQQIYYPHYNQQQFFYPQEAEKIQCI
ncbi:unnamed protein product [Echinostoma caproni]|uniref:Cadherin domain-containing protein n=1 Tax=Echinostoma caproni TaxID=27848 RepID=A0A3P8I458_9TREM|nr:unnamed protein product [Echinostoma caproni]